MSKMYNKGLVLLVPKERDKELSRKMGKRQEPVIYRRNRIVEKNTWKDV